MIKFITILLATAAIAATPAAAQPPVVGSTPTRLNFTVYSTCGAGCFESSTWDQSETPVVVESVPFSGTPDDLGHSVVKVSNGQFTSSYSGPGVFDTVRFIWGINSYFGNISGNINTDYIGVENISPGGLALFSGSVTHPLFAAGTWTAGNTTITATAATGAVPEPAAWAMLIAGFGLTGAAARRRRIAVAA
jgi:hypothetical protein